MKPYYQDDHVTIYHGDCREILPFLAADVVVMDPPYGVGVDYADYEDTPQQLDELIAGVWPLVSRFGRVVVTPGVANIHRWPAPTWTLAWVNAASSGSSSWGFSTWQPVMVYGPDPWLAHGKGRQPDSAMVTTGGGSLVQQLESEHPCPKPIKAMKWIVSRTTWAGDVVIDPFMGSGTTLRAAKDLGRRAVGIDQSERYCEIAAKRMGQEVLDFGGAA